MDQARRDHNKKVLDRIASDPTFREELVEDPKAAMERAGLSWEGDDDVTGYIFAGPMPTPPTGGLGGGLITAPPGGGGSASELATGICDPGIDPPEGGKGGGGKGLTPPTT